MPFNVSVHVQPDYVQRDYPFTVGSRIVNDSDERTEPFAVHYKVVLPNGVDAGGWTFLKHHHMDPHEEWEEVVLIDVIQHDAGTYRMDVALFQDDIQVANGGRDIEIH